MRLLCMAGLAAVLLTVFSWSPPVRACEEGTLHPSATGTSGAAFPSSFSKVVIGSGAPLVRFVLMSEEIAVYTADGSRKLLQKIPYEPAYLNELDSGEVIETVDMNFDGYLDLKIIFSRGVFNIYYHCWLWDQTKQKFVLNEELSGLSLPSFNPAEQTITSSTRDGYMYSEEAIYLFPHNKLEPLKRIEYVYDEDRKLFVTKVYERDENGDMQLVLEEEFVPEVDEGNMQDADPADLQ